MRFVRFREVNVHEGETWNWWLQYDNNEAALLRFGLWVSSFSDEEGYELDLEDKVDEEIVDQLEYYSEEGYYPEHNVVRGQMTVPDDYMVDDLYKGGVADLFSDDRVFHLGDLLSWTTGVMLSPTNIQGIRSVAVFIMGRHVHRLELHFLDEVETAIVSQYPWIAGVTVPDWEGLSPEETVESAQAWLKTQTKRYGEYLVLARPGES